jgi:hypothetical protein
VLDASCCLQTRSELAELLLKEGVDHANNGGRVSVTHFLRYALSVHSRYVSVALRNVQSVLEVAAQRSNVAATEVCLKYGVGGGGKALIIAAFVGCIGVAKVILAHWQEDEEMVNAYTRYSLQTLSLKGLRLWHRPRASWTKR